MLLFQLKDVQIKSQTFIRLYGSGCGYGRVDRLTEVLDTFAEQHETRDLLFIHDHKGCLTVSSVLHLFPEQQKAFRSLWSDQGEDGDECVEFETDLPHPGFSVRDDDEFGIWTENK